LIIKKYRGWRLAARLRIEEGDGGWRFVVGGKVWKLVI
jgi:hypothetical protein